MESNTAKSLRHHCTLPSTWHTSAHLGMISMQTTQRASQRVGMRCVISLFNPLYKRLQMANLIQGVVFMVGEEQEDAA